MADMWKLGTQEDMKKASPPGAKVFYELMTEGNHHRLAGEEEHARRYFAQAWDMLPPGVESAKLLVYASLVECHFLLGEYAKVERLADLLREMDQKGLRTLSIARLARARLTVDKAEAAAAAEELAAVIKKEKVAVRGPARGLTLWDLHEIAAWDAGILT